jgi:Zn-dependent protease with chaperone function
MTRQRFEELVRRIEARYDGRTAELERSTAVWIALGLAGIVSWVGVLLLLGTAAFAWGIVQGPGLGVALLGLGVLLILYGLSQAGLFLLVEHALPEGRVIPRGAAPALVEALESLRRELLCRSFDEVRVSIDFNAGVREVPRLGLFGWPRTFLEVGLPLLMALTPDELRAVLAHEFAHLSGRHGRTGGRIYRLHRRWCNVFEQLQRPASGRSGRAVHWVVTKFVSWYWPRLHARALVLSRVQEFQADRVAAEVAGAATLASSLWRMECLNPWFLEQFWPEIERTADQSPEPPPDLTGRMRTALETPPPPDDAARWIERGLSRATVHDETHPAFPDRVRALGLYPDEFRRAGFPAAPRPSAAEVLLGADRDAFERELSADWQRKSRAAWRQRHRRASAEARRQAPATQAPPAREVSDLWEKAREAADLRGPAAAEALLRSLLLQDPAHAGATVLLGHHLLTRGDGEGERMLLRVVEQADEVWTARACQALQQHFRTTGQTDRLRELRALLDRHEAEVEAARRERSTIRPGDTFLPHGLTEEQVGSLTALLASQPDCTSAWLVRKELRHFPNRPLFVLCVRATESRWGFRSPERDRQLVTRLIPRVELPGQVLVIAREGGFCKLYDRITSLAEAVVFRRSKAEASASAPSGVS